MAAQIFNIEQARQARQARLASETRCHYVDLKPVSKRKAKAISRRDQVHFRAKAAL